MQRDCALHIAGRRHLTSFSVEYKTGGGVGTSGSEGCHLHEDQAHDALNRPVIEKTSTLFCTISRGELVAEFSLPWKNPHPIVALPGHCCHQKQFPVILQRLQLQHIVATSSDSGLRPLPERIASDSISSKFSNMPFSLKGLLHSLIRYRYSFKRYSLEFWWQRWDKKLAFRTRERGKFGVFTDGSQRREKKTSSEAVLQLNSASEKESVLLKEDQTDL
ncbi:hypothetical protein TNCV_3628041 [Trichonephila clavipes]|nr:hypothetical protein TNCV_3628041 [Trichonephila clavipes]